MFRLIYTAPIVAALLSFFYARYTSTPSLPLFNKMASSPTSMTDSKAQDAGQSVLMDQIVLFGGKLTVSPHP